MWKYPLTSSTLDMLCEREAINIMLCPLHALLAFDAVQISDYQVLRIIA